MKPLLRKIGINFVSPFSLVMSYLFKPPLKGDGMMNKQDELKLFSRFNDGLLIDGKSKRLAIM